MIKFVEDELTIKITEEISWEHTVRWVYDKVMEDLMFDAECEGDEELVQKYKELESDKLSHEDKAEIMDLICDDISWYDVGYDEERAEDTIREWIEEQLED